MIYQIKNENWFNTSDHDALRTENRYVLTASCSMALHVGTYLSSGVRWLILRGSGETEGLYTWEDPEDAILASPLLQLAECAE
jgi:hypothetical protein